MLLAITTVVAVLVVVVVVHGVTQSSRAALTALALSLSVCFVGGVLTFANSTFGQRNDYRAALEERYGVEVDWAPSWNGEVTATKDGIEYTCEISGTRTDARLLCNDPLRDEFNN